MHHRRNSDPARDPQHSCAFAAPRPAFDTRTPELFDDRTDPVLEGGTSSASVWWLNHPTNAHERSLSTSRARRTADTAPDTRTSTPALHQERARYEPLLSTRPGMHPPQTTPTGGRSSATRVPMKRRGPLREVLLAHPVAIPTRAP